MKARLSAGAVLFGSLILAATAPVDAQLQPSAGIWLGAAEVGPDQPAAQLGARIEVSPGSRIWLGLDGAMIFVLHDDDEACFSRADCGFNVGGVPNVSALVRVEAPGERIRPYGLAMAGATFAHFGTSALWGGGVGVRMPHVVGRADLALEARYRRVEPLAEEWGGELELMAGIHFR